MGDLNTAHEEFLATSLEDTEYFGTPITFKTRDGATEYSINGSVNKITPEMEGVSAGSVGRPRGHSVGIAVRRTTLMERAGYLDDVDWADNMPTEGWLVVTTDPWTNEIETFTLESGSILEDRTLGIDSFWLTIYEG